MRILRDIALAAELLKKGEIVAFPTETVYGLGAPIFNETAVAKIFTAKGRPADNPLIAHVSDLGEVETIAQNIPAEFHLLATHFFPGPLTVVLEKHPAVPNIVSGGLKTIALRMPRHPLALALIQAVGEPLVAPSANLSGKPSSTTAAHVVADFEGKIAAVLDGGSCEIGLESTVVYLVEGKPAILRLGAIEKEMIEEVLKMNLAVGSEDQRAASPGMKYRHYAPKAVVRLFKEQIDEPMGKNCLRLSTMPKNGYELLLASNLYAWLRWADEKGYDEIAVLYDEKANPALMDRLQRAGK
jgi:L-threonylcarbamoyladenylate synthase